MNKLWLVYGYWNEYDESAQWAVAIYPEEWMAKEHAKRANGYLKKVMKRKSYQEADALTRGEALRENPYDRTDCAIEDNTEYLVEKVDFHPHVDHYLETHSIA